MANDTLSVIVLSEEELANDRFPELPVRLLITGGFPEEGEEDAPARIEIRMRPDRLADLARQAEAAQTSLAFTEPDRAAASPEVAQEQKRAAHVALSNSPSADIDLLKRVLLCLGGELPAAALIA